MSITKVFLSFSALVILVTASLLALPLSAQEEEKEGIGISPTSLKLEADPGEQVGGTFTVINPGDQEVDFRTYVRDFSIRNEEYEKDFEPIEGALSPVEWFQVDATTGTLGPREQRELTYSINVPQDAVPRGYYAVIFAETATPEIDATGVARIKRVGSLVYLTVNGGSVEKGSVVSLAIDRWQRDRPVQTVLRVQNEGNVHFDVANSLRLKDVFGRTISQTETSGTILPATIRKFTPELQLNMPFGIYKVEGDAEFLGQTTELSGKWVLVGSPFWVGLWSVILIGWTVVLIRWVKRRAKRRKH